METKYGVLIFACTVLIFLIIQFAWNQRKNKEQFLKQAKESFGKLPEREYAVEELERISHYFKNYQRKADFYLDELTWNDLGMEDIFLMINQTYSSIGEDYLYWLLRTPVREESVLLERSRLIRYFQMHEEERLHLQQVYAGLGRMRKHSISDYLLRMKSLEQSGNGKHYLIIAAESVSLLLLFINSGMGSILLIASLVYGIMDYYKEKGRVEPYFSCLKQITGMLYYTEELTKVKIPELSAYFEELKQLKKECRKLLRGRCLITSRNMTGSLQEAILDYVKIFTHIDLIQFNKILGILSQKEKEICRMFEIFGFIESMIAAASFRELLLEYCIPEFCSSKEDKTGNPTIIIEGMYHPELSAPVANNIKASKGVLITGSNASGKSTFLKTLGICTVLAQTIMTVPAKLYRADFFRLYSSMAVRDSLSLGESYYLSEIKALRRILTAGEKKQETSVLCLIDEVLRGTNTVERIAASAQVLKKLASENILCFAATHDIELTYMLERIYTNYHFEEDICDGDIHFDYRLRKGRAVTRNAIRLLSLLGYPQEMTEAAEAAASEFIEKGEWKCL